MAIRAADILVQFSSKGEGEVLSAIDNVDSSLGGFTQSVQNNREAIQTAGGVMAGFGGLVTGALVAPMVAGSKAAWGQVDAVEQATFALRAYEQDASKVDEVLGNLLEYAKSDISGGLFWSEDLFAAAQGLKVMGAETENLDEYVQIMSRSVGIGAGTWDRLNEVIGRVGATGRLTGEDFNELAKMGFQLDESIRNTDQSWESLFEHLDQGIPADAMAGQADTIRGRMIWLQGALQDVGAAFLGIDRDAGTFIEGGLGDTLFNGLKQARAGLLAMAPAAAVFGGALASVASVISDVVDAVLDLPQPVQTAILVFTGLAGALTTASGLFLLLLPRIVSTVQAFAQLRAVLTGLSLTAMLTNPLGLAIAALAAFGVAYQTNFLGFGDLVRDTASRARDALSGVVDTLSGAVDAFQETWDSFGGITETLETVTGQWGTYQVLVESTGETVNRFSRFLWSLGAALDSVAVVTGWGWVGTLSNGLEDLARRTEILVGNFQELRNQGFGPVTAALRAVGQVVPSLDAVMVNLADTIASLGDAFTAVFRADWRVVFDNLGDAVGSAWETLRASIDLGADWMRQGVDLAIEIGQIAWGGLTNLYEDLKREIFYALGGASDEERLLNELFDEVLGTEHSIPLGTVAVTVTDWIVEQSGDLWGDLKRKVNEWIGGTPAGDGTSGPMGPGGANQDIPIGEVGIAIGQWAIRASVDLWSTLTSKVRGWLGLGGGAGITDAERQSGVPMSGGIPVDSVLLNIAGWAIEQVQDLAGAVKSKVIEWLQGLSFTSTDMITVGRSIMDGIRAAITVSVQNVADLTATFLSWVTQQIEGVDWESVGATFATLLVGAVKGVVLLAGMGAYLLGQVLLALVDVDWSAVGAAFRDFFIASVKAIGSFLLGFSGQLLGDLMNAVAGVDWGAVGTAMKDFMLSIVPKTLSWTLKLLPDWSWDWSGEQLSPEDQEALEEANSGFPVRNPQPGYDNGESGWSGQNLGSGFPNLRNNPLALAAMSPGSSGAASIPAPTVDWSEFISAAQTALQTVTTAVTTHSQSWPTIVGAQAGAMGGAATSVGTAALTAMQTALQTITVAVTTQSAAWPVIVTAQSGPMGAAGAAIAESARVALANGLQQATIAVTTHSQAWPTIIRAAGSDMYGAGAYAGLMAGAGVAAGLQSALNDVRAAASEIINTVITTMNFVGQMRSPSQRTRKTGRNLGEGMILGMEDTLAAISRSSANMLNAAMPGSGSMPAGSAGASAGRGGDTHIHMGDIHVSGHVIGVDDLVDEVVDGIAEVMPIARRQVARSQGMS